MRLTTEQRAAWAEATDAMVEAYRAANTAAEAARTSMTKLTKLLEEVQENTHDAGCVRNANHDGVCRCRCGKPTADEVLTCRLHNLRAQATQRIERGTPPPPPIYGVTGIM